MKLIFEKKEVGIMVKIKNLEKEETFDYIKMIKYLIEDNKFEVTEFHGEFTDAEKLSVATMLKGINDAIITDEMEEVDKTLPFEEIRPSLEIDDLPF